MEKAIGIIDSIRQCVEKGTLSFIIGAGFSRNISKSFPLWGELLTPLVEELYPQCNVKNKVQREQRIKQIITEKSYLGVASEYVRRHGYHEAIDIYIEQRMPYLVCREDGGYDLMVNGEIVDSNPSIECHKKLLSLDVKHLFTFNYDNSLDILADVSASSRLLEQQERANKQLQILQDALEQYVVEYEMLGINITDAENTSSTEAKDEKIDYTKINGVINNVGLGLTPYSDSVSNFQELYQSHTNAIRTEIAKQKDIVKTTQIQREGKYQLITNAYQISLTDTCKNIYKLHGNLRIGNVPYEFDGDKHMQYVITQEDYDIYPKKHEAFVSLMRISLLKGCLCLIGFSGDDPNFLAWVDWVKDILDESEVRGQHRLRTIYYVNAGSQKLEAPKELLLRNHYIEIINLYECFPDADTQQERISRFLDYLSRDKDSYEVYNESWGRINIERGKLDDIDSLAVDIDNVYKLAEYNKIPNQFGIAHYHRTNIFSRIADIINADINPILRSKLIYSAIKGELMPINAVLNQKQINPLSKVDAELEGYYKRLIVMARVLNGNLQERLPQNYTYEQVLSYLFNLRFDEAKRIIDEWSPKHGIDQMRRFLLQSVYNIDLDTDGITRLINPDNFSCLQEYQYALDVLPQIRGVIMTKKGGGMTMCGDLQPQIDSLSKQNPQLIKFGEQIDKLLSEINTNKTQPFGNVKNTINFGSYDIALINATKVLQIFVELGVPTEAKNVLLFDKEKWLKVCEILYERYPLPCLYFSLLYGNNKDLLRRIAQHYIYSIKLKDTLPKLLTIMLEALLNESCPFNVTEAIYIVAPIFMKAVNEEIWVDAFEKVYDKQNIEMLGDGRMAVNDIQEFITTGVSLSNCAIFKHKVLLQTLQLQDKIKDVHNRLIIASSKDIEVNDAELRELKQLIVCAATPTHIYVLMNMRKWVGDDDIAGKLQVLPDAIYNDCTLLEAACEFSYGHATLQSKLTNIILNSTRLWQTGISDDCSSVSHYGYTLDICDVQQFIKFNRDEIFVIYVKLKEAFAKIYRITQKWNERKMWGPFNDWSYILVEMQNFLKSNRTELRDDVNYSTLLRSITRLLNQGRGGNSMASLLIDDDKTGKAISWLVNDVHLQGVKPFQYEYMLLANKILTRKSKYLNSCFIHFGWTLTKYTEGYDINLFKPLIKDILDFYGLYFTGKNELDWDIEYAEKDVVERELCKMYEVYKSWGGKIRFWDDYIPRYYSK